jgi:hypothetical protein
MDHLARTKKGVERVHPPNQREPVQGDCLHIGENGRAGIVEGTGMTWLDRMDNILKVLI